MVILWRYPQDFLWACDGYGDRNSVPTAVQLMTLHPQTPSSFVSFKSSLVPAYPGCPGKEAVKRGRISQELHTSSSFELH